jgi:hypothetical protein
MHTYWNSYLEPTGLISKGKDFDHQDAIDWIFKLNPHRYVSHLEEFLKFISKGSLSALRLLKNCRQKKKGLRRIVL